MNKLYTVCWADTLQPLRKPEDLQGWPSMHHIAVGSKDSAYAALDKTKERAKKYFPQEHEKYERRGLVVVEVKLEVVK